MMMRLLLVIAFVQFSSMTAVGNPTAEAIVQKQLEAYNARDLDAFVATYTEDVQLFDLPDKLVTSGRAELRERYARRFADPLLHATIVNRIVLGDTVVDHERLRRGSPEGPGTLEAIAVYHVRDGKIAKVWFERGEFKLDPAGASKTAK
jgi:hypothetical protein